MHVLSHVASSGTLPWSPLSDRRSRLGLCLRVWLMWELEGLHEYVYRMKVSEGGRVGRPPRIYNNVSTRVCWHSTNGKPLTAMCCVQCFTPRCLMYISDYPPSNKLSMASVYWRRCIYPLFAHPFTTEMVLQAGQIITFTSSTYFSLLLQKC